MLGAPVVAFRGTHEFFKDLMTGLNVLKMFKSKEADPQAAETVTDDMIHKGFMSGKRQNLSLSL
jgi:hypothetical protein